MIALRRLGDAPNLHAAGRRDARRRRRGDDGDFQRRDRGLVAHAGGLLVLSTSLMLGCDAPELEYDADTAPQAASTQALIGVTDGDSDHLLGRIVGVASDGAGVTYVADEMGSSVRAYDPTGTYLGTVGAEGDGPGEFRYLLGLDVDRDGRLHVRGAFRMSVFERSANGQFADSVVRTFEVLGAEDREVRGRAGEGVYYAPGFFWEDFEIRGYFYLAYDSAGLIADTVFVPAFPDMQSTGLAHYRVNERGGRNVEGISRAPFEPTPSWDITDQGHIWFASGQTYEILELGPAGDTLRTIHRPHRPWPVPSDEYRDSAEAFQTRLDSVPVPLDDIRGISEAARRSDLPTVLPPVVAVHVGEDGRIWVRQWSREDRRETVFDVFGPSGVRERTVLIPEALMTHPVPWLGNERVVGVVQDAGTGVQRVGIFELPDR